MPLKTSRRGSNVATEWNANYAATSKPDAGDSLYRLTPRDRDSVGNLVLDERLTFTHTSNFDVTATSRLSKCGEF